jgi:SAM-dependent methyltransferase
MSMTTQFHHNYSEITLATQSVATRKASKKSNKPVVDKKANSKPAKTVTKVDSPNPNLAKPKMVSKAENRSQQTIAKEAIAKIDAKAKKPSPPKIKSETVKSWYDYPELYEMGFLKETPKEAVFLGDVFKKYVPFPVKRVLELGCGSGRLICDMSTRGYQMTGLDLNPTALDYCKKKLKKLGTKGNLVVGDMTNFHFEEPFDAAVNAINTFRHLESEEAALAHLNCVADHLKPGGVFVLSLHLLPPDGDLWGTERWSAKQDNVSVYYALTVVETSMKTRLEKLRISMLVKEKDEEPMRLSDHITLRIYTAKQLKSLLAKAKKFKLIAVHDFWCDIDSVQKLNDEAVDTVLVLQKV